MATQTAWRKLSEGPLSPPLFHSNPCVDTSARPYHHRPLFSWMLGRGRWWCHKHLYRFCMSTCCQQTLISPNNCTAPVLSKAFVGSLSPSKCHNRFWLTLSFCAAWLILLCLVRHPTGGPVWCGRPCCCKNPHDDDEEQIFEGVIDHNVVRWAQCL